MLINLKNQEVQTSLEKRAASKIAQQMIGFSEVVDNVKTPGSKMLGGRAFAGVDFSHFINEVVPTMIRAAIQETIEEVEK